MTEDQWNELRDRIAGRIHAVDCGCDELPTGTQEDRARASAVMDLFVDVVGSHPFLRVGYAVLRVAEPAESSDG